MGYNCKVKEYTKKKKEYQALAAQLESFVHKLAEKRITALAFEFIKDEDGTYPAVRALSEIAGTASVLIASELLFINIVSYTTELHNKESFITFKDIGLYPPILNIKEGFKFSEKTVSLMVQKKELS